MDQRHALANSLGTFSPIPATSEPITDWLLASLTESLTFGDYLSDHVV